MKRTTPDFLRCPTRSGELNLDASTADPIDTGSLT